MSFLSSALQMNRVYAKDMLRLAVQKLQQAEIESASLDARLLLQHVLGVSREQLLADDKLIITPIQQMAYLEMVTKRERRQPVSQLIGKREFWGNDFIVTSKTLDPRPDSETLIEAVLKVVKDRQTECRILDLGTGTGCLLLTLLSEYPNATGLGIDISKEALAVAKLNAQALWMTKRAQFLHLSWDDVPEEGFDVVISNPPYIQTTAIDSLAVEVRDYEPHLALDGGNDGLDCYRSILVQLPRLLAKDGVAVFEIGVGQQKELLPMIQESGFHVVAVKEDLAGMPRCIIVENKR